ncbi:TolC family protein [Mangrovibacterium diazotrophicum]|uniref:Outer membrane protein TolC n=1 Tax=Mangrovibacterium diazotrophicum TaxID=1261403 RepID=A0A419W2W4_9BACT|nr:TolC family protein [Mangrovibacterium diazotrophicum]RKD89827.1 outer membrane protein TolC [Mangrovibacterium diazotrophicum]
MRIVLWIFAFCVIFNQPATAQETTETNIPINLQQAWQRADEYSTELRSQRIDQQIKNEHVLDIKQNWLPSVEVDASYGKLANIPVFVNGILHEAEYIPLEDHSTYDANIEAYFNIYNGKKTKLSVEKAEAQADMAEHIAQASQSEIHYEVASYYLDLLRTNEFEKIIEQNIYRNSKRLDQITQLYDNGVVLKSDLLRAQLQLSQQKVNLQKMQNNKALAGQHLNLLMGYEDAHPLQLADSIEYAVPDTAMLYADYISVALKQSPFEKMADTQISMSELEQKEIKAEKLPRIGMFGKYSYSYPQIMLYPYSTSPYLLGIAGVKISYNLSSLYHNKHKESAAALEVQQQYLAKEQTEETLRTKINEAYKRFKEDQDNIEVSKISVQQAEENYRIVNQTYFNKLALLTDLLEADTQLQQAQFDLVNNYIAARMHFYQLQKITGEL